MATKELWFLSFDTSMSTLILRYHIMQVAVSISPLDHFISGPSPNGFHTCFVCTIIAFPFRHFEIPVHYCKLKKKLNIWKGKSFPYGGWLVLINIVLTSLSMFMSFFFQVPKWVQKGLTIDYLDSSDKVMIKKDANFWDSTAGGDGISAVGSWLAALWFRFIIEIS